MKLDPKPCDECNICTTSYIVVEESPVKFLCNECAVLWLCDKVGT